MRIKDFLKGGHPPTLFSVFLYFGISVMVWVLIGVLGVFIAEDFGLTASQTGLLAAIPILGGSLVRIPLGLLADHIGSKKTGIIGQVTVFIPLLGIWLFGKDFSTLIGFGFLLGIAGGSFAVALPLASRWYLPGQQGMVLGIAGAGNGGTVLASCFAPALAEMLGWRNVFGLALIPVAITLILFIRFAKESPVQPQPQKLKDYFSILKEADTLWFCLFYSITFGGFAGLASFLGIFFYDQYALSKVTAGHMTALCVFAGSFLRPVGGYLADRFGGVRILTVLFAALSILMFGVSHLPPLAWAVFLIFLTMMCLGMGNGAVFGLVPLRFPKHIGVLTGVVGAAGGLGGFFLSALLGYFKQTAGTYGPGFLGFSVMAALALGILHVVQKGWSFSRPIPPALPVSGPVPEKAGKR